MSPSRGGSDGDRMHIPYRLGLRDKTKQIGSHLGPVANHEGRVSEFTDQERMVQVTGIAPVPEFEQLVENLDVVLLGAGRYFRILVHGASLKTGSLAAQYRGGAPAWARRKPASGSRCFRAAARWAAMSDPRTRCGPTSGRGRPSRNRTP